VTVEETELPSWIGDLFRMDEERAREFFAETVTAGQWRPYYVDVFKGWIDAGFPIGHRADAVEYLEDYPEVLEEFIVWIEEQPPWIQAAIGNNLLIFINTDKAATDGGSTPRTTGRWAASPEG
jgi:hypothetical protein